MNSKQGLVLYGRYLNTKEGMAGTIELILKNYTIGYHNFEKYSI